MLPCGSVRTADVRAEDLLKRQLDDRDAMHSIGEFSKIVGLTVKALRFYHKKGVLTPAYVEPQTGYRYYDQPQVETARVVRELRLLEFSLDEIREIVAANDDEADILQRCERQLLSIGEESRRLHNVADALEKIIANEREAQEMMQNTPAEVMEKTIDEMLIAAVRMRARYDECGIGFREIGRRFGRYICGKPMLLHYDSEYKEEDADYEACMPIRQGDEVEAGEGAISVRKLPGGRCLALLHRGAYTELLRSYEKIFNCAQDQGLLYETPTREIYIKGPGMIFRGNPKKYLTEIQLMLRD